MVSIDLIGLAVTLGIIGLRYPLYALAAAAIHEFGRLAMTVFLSGQVEAVVAAGAFSTTTVSDTDLITAALIAFGGPLANFIIGATSGGLLSERTEHVIDPRSTLRNPFAVVNFRLALFSCLFNIGQFW